jgi:hypothetical protein
MTALVGGGGLHDRWTSLARRCAPLRTGWVGVAGPAFALRGGACMDDAAAPPGRRARPPRAWMSLIPDTRLKVIQVT